LMACRHSALKAGVRLIHPAHLLILDAYANEQIGVGSGNC
jgi:hypothetical protein